MTIPWQKLDPYNLPEPQPMIVCNDETAWCVSVSVIKMFESIEHYFEEFNATHWAPVDLPGEEGTMTDTPTLDQVEIFARDLDGTGSMHICWSEDPGAVKFVREDTAQSLVVAAIRNRSEADG